MSWRFISDSLIIAFPIIFLVKGFQSLNLIIFCGIISLFNELIKHIVKSERPDKSDKLSFPSNHSSVSFFIALYFNNIFLYIWSLIIGISRYKLKRHRKVDIIFGFFFAFVWFVFYQKNQSFLYLL